MRSKKCREDGVVSDLSSRKKPVLTESLSDATLGAQPQKKITPVRVWATVGGLILAFQLYVWGKWVTGPPHFERVPAGPPTDPPTFMKAILFTWTAVIVVSLPIAIWCSSFDRGAGNGESPWTACSSCPAACCGSRTRC